MEHGWTLSRAARPHRVSTLITVCLNQAKSHNISITEIAEIFQSVRSLLFMFCVQLWLLLLKFSISFPLVKFTPSL